MSNDNRTTLHRKLLGQVRTAIATWTAADRPRRREIGESIYELLLPAEQDTDGDATLDAVSSIYEEYDDVLPQSLTVQFQALVSAAHALGQRRQHNEPRATKWLDETHGILHPQWFRLRGYDVLQLGAADYVLDGSGGLLSVNGDSHNEWNALPFGVRWALTADDIAAGHYGSARLDGLAVAEFRKRGLLSAAHEPNEMFRILAKRDGTGRLGPAESYTKALGRPEEFTTWEQAEARAEQYRRMTRETFQKSGGRSNPLSYTVVAVRPSSEQA